MVFFLIVALIYFFMHMLVWTRMVVQLGLGWKGWLAGSFVALGLALTPFLAYLIPSGWSQPLVRSLWWLVFVWMGMLFYLFWLQILSFILETIFNRLPATWTGWFPRQARQLHWVSAIAVLTVIYGLYAASQWQMPRIQIASTLIAKDTTIVLISDTHFGVMTPQAWVERLVDAIASLEPDLVLLAGDQINDHPEWLPPKAAVWAELNPPLGVFGVLGNHEYYVGFEQSQAFHDQAGITLLRNETLILPETGIQLMGIDDPTWGLMDRQFMIRQLERLASELSADHFQILLAHRPWAWDEKVVQLGIPLMVAGHTHGGQIFPFNWIARQPYPYLVGHFRQAESHLIVTAGAGTWGPPMRVGARPEIVIIELQRQKD